MGSVFPPSLADTGLVVRLGLLLGPAALFYPPAGFKAHRMSGVEEVCRGEVEDLITSAPPDELDESGPEGSRALARRLGLVELGAQLSLEPA